jgi:hypothetical protein
LRQHLGRVDDFAAIRLDVGGAQPLGERRRNGLVDEIGFTSALSSYHFLKNVVG